MTSLPVWSYVPFRRCLAPRGSLVFSWGEWVPPVLTSRDGCCSSWYASYWNEFLFTFVLGFKTSYPRPYMDQWTFHNALTFFRLISVKSSPTHTEKKKRYFQVSGEICYRIEYTSSESRENLFSNP